MVTTRSTDARTSADEASVPEEHLETPGPTESDAEEEVAVDDNSSNGEPSTKSFRPNSNDSSSEESLEETPPPKRKPTAKAKPAARSRSRNTSKAKKFNPFDKPAPFVPLSRPAAPSQSFLLSPSFKKNDSATTRKDGYYEQLEDAREYAKVTHQDMTEQLDGAMDHIHDLTAFISSLEKIYHTTKAELDNTKVALAQEKCKVTAKTAEVKSLNATISGMKGQIKMLSQQVKELQSKKKSASNSVEEHAAKKQIDLDAALQKEMNRIKVRRLADEQKMEAKSARFISTTANSAKSADGTWQSLIKVSIPFALLLETINSLS